MSSINTNAGAMTALQTLKATNKALDTTQGRISTGYRVSEASHNAAYWSIATTMRSDNNAMSTVKDALGLGAAQVDIAYTAMDAVKDTLDNMKKKLVAAQQPNIDKAAIQEEINQLQNDLKTYAQSATFSGGNWLDVDATGTQKVVASFVRDASGISLATIDVDTAKTALFTQANTGVLQQDFTVVDNVTKTGVTLGQTSTPSTSDGAAATATITGFDPADWNEGDTISFSITAPGGSAVDISLTIGANAPTATDFNNALTAAGVAGVTVSHATTVLTFSTVAADTLEDDAIVIGSIAATEQEETEQAGLNVTNFEITTDGADLASYLSNIETAFAAVTTAASDLGAIKTRISSQQDFVGKIMDAVSRGVGQLVDADMEEESTRLQALQVQQQLGIQALSIANGNSQNILSLFR
jgi:flagellin